MVLLVFYGTFKLYNRNYLVFYDTFRLRHWQYLVFHGTFRFWYWYYLVFSGTFRFCIGTTCYLMVLSDLEFHGTIWHFMVLSDF